MHGIKEVKKKEREIFSPGPDSKWKLSKTTKTSSGTSYYEFIDNSGVWYMVSNGYLGQFYYYWIEI